MLTDVVTLLPILSSSSSITLSLNPVNTSVLLAYFLRLKLLFDLLVLALFFLSELELLDCNRFGLIFNNLFK